jgi:hypothetical protein
VVGVVIRHKKRALAPAQRRALLQGTAKRPRKAPYHRGFPTVTRYVARDESIEHGWGPHDAGCELSKQFQPLAGHCGLLLTKAVVLLPAAVGC